MSRRTLDTESITLRQVNVLTPTNDLIPALTTLTSDGQGGTFWATPSSLGGIPAYNQVVVDNNIIPATTPFNTLYLSTSQGLGSIVNSTLNLVTLYSKGFDTFDISGGNKVASYANSILSPTMKLVGRSGVRISGDPYTRTLYFDAETTTVPPGPYNFSHINVISNASTFSLEAVDNSNNLVITADTSNSRLNLIGLGDIILNGSATSNAVYMSISTFNSAEYLNISTLAHQSYGSTLSTVSTLFCDIPTYSGGISTLSSVILNSVSTLSTTVGLRQQRDENNLMYNYTEINLYKALSSAVAANSKNVVEIQEL